MNLMVSMQKKKNSIRGDVANFSVDSSVWTPVCLCLFSCHGDKALDMGIRKGYILGSKSLAR